MPAVLKATDKDFEQMMQLLSGFFVTQIAGAVATHSIADHLTKEPATAEEISNMTGIDSTATFRLLRACASLGLVAFDGLTFSATPLLGTLRTDVPGSLRSLAIAWSAPGVWLSWGRFMDAVRTGESQTVPALGAELWDYYGQKPEEGAAFTHAMHGFTSGIALEVARVVHTSSAKLAVEQNLSSKILQLGDPVRCVTWRGEFTRNSVVTCRGLLSAASQSGEQNSKRLRSREHSMKMKSQLVPLGVVCVWITVGNESEDSDDLSRIRTNETWR